MAEFIYQMIKARKAYGDRVILDDVTLSFLPGAKIGVVGPNGMGKSTLLKIMAGLDTVSNGEASLTPGYTVGILQQEPPLDDTKTVGENIKMAFGEIAEKVARFNQIGEEMANPDADFDALMDEMGKLQNDIDAANGWDLDSQLEQAMDALQCPDPDTPVTVCSGGERRRVALCKLLLEAPDLLLLDEPTNHLDAESILWLEQFLHQYKGAVIAVTHDRYFMDNVAEWICEVDRGQLYPYKGNYTTYLETKAKRMEIQGAKDAKLAKRLKSELDWVRSSPKARQAKNKARLERYDQMEQEARNNKKLDFSEIQIPAGPRLGSTVLEAEHIHKAFGDRVLIDGQQRVTTVFLLLAAIRRQLRDGKVAAEEPGLADDIEDDYLIDRRHRREQKLRLKLIKSDSAALEAVLADVGGERVASEPRPALVMESNVTQNYLYFLGRVEAMDVSVEDLMGAIESLCVIDITLDPTDDA